MELGTILICSGGYFCYVESTTTSDILLLLVKLYEFNKYKPGNVYFRSQILKHPSIDEN